MSGLEASLVLLLTLSGTIFGIMYFYFTTRNRERLALIEKNADPSILKTEPVSTFKTFAIKLGMLLAGAGIGLLIGEVLSLTTRMEEGIAYASMILIFSGAGLVLSYIVSGKLKSKT